MSINFQELLEKERFKNAMPTDLYSEYHADQDKIFNEMLDHGNEVLRLSWLGGMVDGGFVKLIEWHGFYFTQCSDTGDKGPFDSFEDALGGNFDHYVPEPELDSEVLTLDQLRKIALAIFDPNGEEPIKINGNEYMLRDGEIVEVKE